jgi:hypothetical protein
LEGQRHGHDLVIQPATHGLYPGIRQILAGLSQQGKRLRDQPAVSVLGNFELHPFVTTFTGILIRYQTGNAFSLARRGDDVKGVVTMLRSARRATQLENQRSWLKLA